MTSAEHVIEIRAKGFTIMHPLACRPNLFDCPVNVASEEQLTEPPGQLGRFVCSLTDDGQFVIGDPAHITESTDEAAADVAARAFAADMFDTFADFIDKWPPGPTLPPSVFSAMAREKATDLRTDDTTEETR
jgi:hypothetical protein